MYFQQIQNRPVLLLLVLAVIYVLMVELGQFFIIPSSGVSPFWPPAGFALAMAILLGARALPGIFTGAFLQALVSNIQSSNNSIGTSLLLALIIGGSVTIQPWLGALLLRVTHKGRYIAANSRLFVIFLLCVPVIALTSSTLGLLLLNLSGIYEWDTFVSTWVVWWGADVTGMAIMAPLLITASRKDFEIEKNRIAFLSTLMTVVVGTIVAVTLTLLYDEYYRTHRERLEQVLGTQTELIRSVALYDRVNGAAAGFASSREATISQMTNAYRNYSGLGETGEFVLGQMVNGIPELTFAQRSPDTPLSYTSLAETPEPMRLALRGESGSITSRDFRGIRVLAAYTWIPELEIGIVAKTDMSEIVQPFVMTTLTATATALVMVFFAAYVFRQVTEPVLQKLHMQFEEQEALVARRTSELDQNRKRFMNMVDSIPGAPYECILDKHWTMLYLSEEIERITGYPATDFLHNRVRSFASIIHGDDREYIVAEKEKAVASRETYTIEYRIRHASGGTRWIYEKGRVNSAPAEGSQIINGTLVDISDRKASEDAIELARQTLHDQNLFQQALIDTIPNPLFYKDASTRMLGCNQAYLDIFGITAETIIGKRVIDLEFLPMEDRLAYQAEDERVIARLEHVQREMLMPFSDGKMHHTLYAVAGFALEDGSPGGLVGTIVDISQLKEITHQLEIARDAAEAATRAKASFLASMSHEIRTPMNGIIGMVELMAQSDLSAENRKMLQTIADSGQSLLTIINDILDFSKIEAGRLELEYLPVNLVSMIESSAETLAPAAAAKKVTLHTFVDPALPAELMADPVRLRQIIINLGGNAVKFSENGTVVIRLDCVEADGPAMQVKLSVIDDGIGIPEAAQRSLFQAFSQAESSTTRKFGGTGLGLSICQRLTELMDGKIGVTSTPGEGSTFHVTLPMKRCGGGLPLRADLSGLHIMLCSSSTIEQEVVRGYLGSCDGEVDLLAEPDMAELIPSLTGNPRPILILGSTVSTEVKEALRNALPKATDVTYPRLVLLQNGRLRDKVRTLDAHSVALDISPLKRLPLIAATAICAGRQSPEIEVPEHRLDLEKRFALTVEEAREQGTLILVAEDNPTNQDVIGRQLKMLGYTCEMFENGALALKAWRTGDYAILLTDCHMPEMDGFELTDAIRKEQHGAASRFPIIAITANAMAGEAERCLSSGMDDYMSKPLRIQELQEKLRTWMPHGGIPHNREPVSARHAAGSPDALSTGQLPGDAPPIDASVLKGMFGDDDVMFREILTEFLAPTRKLVAELTAAVARLSMEEVKQAAHKLKSAARSVGALELGDIADQLELQAKEGELLQSEAQMKKITDLMQRIERYVCNLKASSGS